MSAPLDPMAHADLEKIRAQNIEQNDWVSSVPLDRFPMLRNPDAEGTPVSSFLKRDGSRKNVGAS